MQIVHGAVLFSRSRPRLSYIQPRRIRYHPAVGYVRFSTRKKSALSTRQFRLGTRRHRLCREAGRSLFIYRQRKVEVRNAPCFVVAVMSKVRQRIFACLHYDELKMNRALFIEASSALRSGCSEYLQYRGIDTYAASTLADARALLPVLKPDVAALDSDLEEGDGLEMIQDIVEAGSRCLIISARDEARDRILALSRGADAYLVKPVNAEELYLRIRNILANSALPQQRNQQCDYRSARYQG